MQRILFVCLGNICRSPSAEAVARSLAAQAGLSVEFDSCGTGDWHVGEPPHPPAVAAALRRGHDMRNRRARQLRAGDFDKFDLLLAMDRANLSAIASLRPAGNRTEAQLFLSFLPEAGAQTDLEVPDPYFTGDYEAALNLIEEGAQALVAGLSGRADHADDGRTRLRQRTQRASARSPKLR